MSETEQAIFAGALVFCRIAGCVMAMPGLSSARFPMRARLALAVLASLAVAPLVRDRFGAPALSSALPDQAAAILSETIVGIVMGLLVRVYVLAFEMMTAAMSTAIGLSAAFAPPVEGDQLAPALAGALTLGATMLFFAAGLDAQMLRALVGSYAAVPPGAGLAPQAGLQMFLTSLQEASLICLQLAAPILILSIAANLAFGLVSRFMPQAPIYFVSTPLMIGVGLLVLYFTGRSMFEILLDAMSRRLETL